MRWIALQACSIEPVASTEEAVPGGVGRAVAPRVTNLEAAQQAICAISLSFTPRVAMCGSAVVLEVSGSLRLFGGLHKLAALLESDLHTYFKQIILFVFYQTMHQCEIKIP